MRLYGVSAFEGMGVSTRCQAAEPRTAASLAYWLWSAVRPQRPAGREIAPFAL